MIVTIGKQGLQVDNYGEKYTSTNLIEHLSNRLQIAPGTTLEDIFNLLALNTEMIEKVFYSDLGASKIQPYIDDIRSPTEERSELTYLAFKWGSEFYSNDVDQVNELSIYPDFGGYNESEDEWYGLSLTSLPYIKHVEVKIHTKIAPHYIKDNKPVQAFESTFPVTVYDFIRAVIRELMLHEDPERRNEITDQLSSSEYEITT